MMFFIHLIHIIKILFNSFKKFEIEMDSQGNMLYQCTLLHIICKHLQGGQNFFEPIRTKIRTFSEEIRTIRTIFEKQSVQSVQFFKKKSVQSVHFFKPIRTFF